MVKPTQILQIEPPAEITFKRPFTDVVTSHIKISNTSDKQVCFKVKTTARKQYCVRPNSGLIPAHGTVNVSVMMQPFDYYPEEPNKHKFMIQSIVMPDGEQSIDHTWKNAPAKECMDYKLLVKFDSPLMKSSLPVISSDNAEIRHNIYDVKRLQRKLQQMEEENNQLRERVKQLESQQTSSMYSTVSSSHCGEPSSFFNVWKS